MKKGALLNSDISTVIARMGHTDQITLGDAGLPVPHGVQRIDLAVSRNLPPLLPVLKAVLVELEVEAVVLAEELQTVSPAAYAEIVALIQAANSKVRIQAVPHEAFKAATANSKAVIRTGECTPYVNIILQSGVSF